MIRARRPVTEMKDAVAAVMRELASHRGSAGGDVVDETLKKVLTKKEQEHIKVKYFDKGVLHIGVDSSAWLYKLSLEKNVLLDKLKPQLKSLKDIRLSIGEST